MKIDLKVKFLILDPVTKKIVIRRQQLEQVIRQFLTAETGHWGEDKIDMTGTETTVDPINMVFLRSTDNIKPSYFLATTKFTAACKTNLQHDRDALTLNWKFPGSNLDALVMTFSVAFRSNMIKCSN